MPVSSPSDTLLTLRLDDQAPVPRTERSILPTTLLAQRLVFRYRLGNSPQAPCGTAPLPAKLSEQTACIYHCRQTNLALSQQIPGYENLHEEHACRIRLAIARTSLKKSASLVAHDECNRIERCRSILFPIQKPINDSRYREPFEQDQAAFATPERPFPAVGHTQKIFLRGLKSAF